MRLSVRVIPRSRSPGVEAAADGRLLVRVAEPAEQGRANAAVVAALARHFHVSKAAVVIRHGHAGRRKLVEISAG